MDGTSLFPKYMNMSDKNISFLIIGGKGCSVSEGLFKCLNMAGHENITLLEYNEHNALYYRINKRVIATKTPDDDIEYVKELIDICVNRKIQIIIPGSTWEAKIIAKHVEFFLNNNITPLVNNYETINLCSNKKSLSVFLESQNISVPQTFNSISEANNYFVGHKLSIIIKPISGRGSQNVFVAKTDEELRAIVYYFNAKKIDYILQEHISDAEHEYTIGVVSNKKGEYMQSIVMKRQLFGGATGYAKVVKDKEIERLSEKVSCLVKSSGPINIQLRQDYEGKPYIFEVNPRFSGSAPMRALAGFNEVDIIIKNFCCGVESCQYPIKYNYEFFRVFQEICVSDKATPKNGLITNYL